MIEIICCVPCSASFKFNVNTNVCDVMQSKPKFMNTNVHNDKFI